MSFKRTILLNEIADNLAFSSKSITLQNVVGLFDNNRGAQDFFSGLFKLVFGFEHLKDLDKLNGVTNYPAIDLGDAHAKIAFQITSQSDSGKIKDTISRFLNHGLFKTYDKLVVFIIGEKKGYTTSFDTEGKFVFDSSIDIWDDNHLIKTISEIEDTDRIEEISGFLKKNLEEYKFPDRLTEYDVKTCIGPARIK